MTVTFKGYFIQQADYQHWANEVLFAALERLDDGMRQGEQPGGSIHRTMDRILVETRNWAARLKGDGQSPIGSDTALCADWKDLKDALRREVRGLQHWLEEMPESYFEERVFYQRGAERESLWVRDALTHLMIRMAHLRGEASGAVARLGFAPPEMDYVRYKGEMEQHIAHLKEAEEARRAEKP